MGDRNWEKLRKKRRKVVIESFVQLLVQSILVYVVLGPGEGEDSSTTG